METKKITPEMYEALKAPLPVEAVSQHPTKTFLSSIKAIYVTERLNDVFGCGQWRIETDEVSVKEETGFVVVKVKLSIPEYGVYYESFGGNDNGGAGKSKNFDLGDAYKGATTDAITKIGSYLGIAIDVFKGKVSHKKATAEAKHDEEDKKWLNVLDRDKNMTREWVNILSAIGDGKVASVADVRKHYKVSNEIALKIEEQLNK